MICGGRRTSLVQVERSTNRPISVDFTHTFTPSLHLPYSTNVDGGGKTADRTRWRVLFLLMRVNSVLSNDAAQTLCTLECFRGSFWSAIRWKRVVFAMLYGMQASYYSSGAPYVVVVALFRAHTTEKSREQFNCDSCD